MNAILCVLNCSIHVAYIYLFFFLFSSAGKCREVSYNSGLSAELWLSPFTNRICMGESASSHGWGAWALEAAWMSIPNKLINFIITLHKIYFDRWSNNSSRNLIASTIYGIRGCCNHIHSLGLGTFSHFIFNSSNHI